VTLLGKTVGVIFDVFIEPPPFVNEHNGGVLARRARNREVPARAVGDIDHAAGMRRRCGGSASRRRPPRRSRRRRWRGPRRLRGRRRPRAVTAKGNDGDDSSEDSRESQHQPHLAYPDKILASLGALGVLAVAFRRPKASRKRAQSDRWYRAG